MDMYICEGIEYAVPMGKQKKYDFLREIKDRDYYNYSGRPSSTFAFRTLRVLFSPLTRLKMLICGGGALLGSQCMEIKVSYVQARRFIDFHTLDPE